VPAVAAALTLSAVALPTLAQAAVVAHTASTTVNVTASDFKFKLSATSAKPGSVTFKITNKGAVKHDFQISGHTSSMISPGKTTTLTVSLSKAGSFAYKCTVPGHAALGMKGTFKIT
jgi:iron uptake system component EfeO